MKTYIVQLEDHDDVISARDKISWSKAGRVLLLWPRKGRVLDRRVDLLLLQRYSRQLGSQLAFVTRDGEVKMHARELGIPVFSNAVQAQQSGWRRLRQRRKLPWQRPGRVSPAALRAQREELHARPAEKRWLRLVMFTVGVLSFLGLALFFAPGAQVQLQPVRKTQSLNLAVWASPAIHTPTLSGGIPAQAVTVVVEGRDQADSTGLSRVPNTRAAGQVLLTNLTGQPVDVPLGSLLRSTDEPVVRYQTTSSVQVPAGSGISVVAAIQAVVPGSTGNLPAGSIRALEGPAGLRVAVENMQPISGGTDRTAPAPSEKDYQALREKLLEKLKGNALDEMRKQMKPGQRLLDGTLRLRSVIQETREPALDQPADQLQLSSQVEYEAWYVNETDLQAMAQAVLSASPSPGFQAVPGSLQFVFLTQPTLDSPVPAPVSVKNEPGAGQGDTVNPETPADPETSANTETTTNSARWELQLQRTMEASWSEADILQAILGKRVGEAQRILQARISLAAEPRIAMYPDWWSFLPYLPARIQLVKQ